MCAVEIVSGAVTYILHISRGSQAQARDHIRSFVNSSCSAPTVMVKPYTTTKQQTHNTQHTVVAQRSSFGSDCAQALLCPKPQVTILQHLRASNDEVTSIMVCVHRSTRPPFRGCLVYMTACSRRLPWQPFRCCLVGLQECAHRLTRPQLSACLVDMKVCSRRVTWPPFEAAPHAFRYA